MHLLSTASSFISLVVIICQFFTDVQEGWIYHVRKVLNLFGTKTFLFCLLCLTTTSAMHRWCSRQIPPLRYTPRFSRRRILHLGRSVNWFCVNLTSMWSCDVLVTKGGRPSLHSVYGTEPDKSVPITFAVTRSWWTKNVLESRSAFPNPLHRLFHDDKNVRAKDLRLPRPASKGRSLPYQHHHVVSWGTALGYADLCMGCNESWGHEAFIDKCSCFRHIVCKFIHEENKAVKMEFILT